MNGETISCLEYAYHSGMWALVTSSGSVWLDRGRADAESSYYRSLRRALTEYPNICGLSFGNAKFNCWVLIHSDGKGVLTYGRLPRNLTRDLERAVSQDGGVKLIRITLDRAPHYLVVTRRGNCYGVTNGEQQQQRMEGLLLDRTSGLEMYWDEAGGIFYKHIPESLERELRRALGI